MRFETLQWGSTGKSQCLSNTDKSLEYNVLIITSMYDESPSVRFSSVAQSCLTLCDPMDCSMPGFPVYHQLPELAQTHVH